MRNNHGQLHGAEKLRFCHLAEMDALVPKEEERLPDVIDVTFHQGKEDPTERYGLFRL
jgi:hypothetical protein